MPFYRERLEHHPFMRLKMLHFFVNTGIRDTAYYWNELNKALKVYCDLRKVCPHLTALNIGGGLPIKNSLAFHYDYAYDRNPTEFISLYGEKIAPGATPTCFASSARALDRLPATLRAAIEKRHALHACFMDRSAPAAERAAVMDDAIPRGQPGWSSADWRIARPLVWHNRAGVPSLYACLQHTIRVLDMDIADSDALLAQLFDTLYRADNLYEHQWRPGDLVIWDNTGTMHRAEWYDPTSDRMMHRTKLRGEEPFA
jgi:alpha-ketoglutarate-dependent taurine dioxygenase